MNVKGWSEQIATGTAVTRWQSGVPWLSAGFTTRRGGNSTGVYSTLNCGLHVGDVHDHVIHNRRTIAAAAGFDFAAWTNAEQVHGNEVAVVTAEERGRGRLQLDDALPGADAMITNESGLCLTAFFADCVPLYFVDPVQHAVGIAHAGWRGTAARIAERTVQAMEKQYGSQPERLLAAIGPSIGGCCYEVGEHVVSQIRRLEGHEAALSDGGSTEIFAETKRKWHLDLKQLNRHFMIKAGMLPEHIECSPLCTSCRTDVFFSHRRENGQTGRMAGWIGIALEPEPAR